MMNQETELPKWRSKSPALGRPPKDHIAIQEALNWKAVEWMEKVTDEEYQRQPNI